MFMDFYQCGHNLLLTRGTTIKTGILTLTEFWWVPQNLEIVVPKSPHDQFYLKRNLSKHLSRRHYLLVWKQGQFSMVDLGLISGSL